MRIQTRVFLTILLCSVLLVASMVQLMQWSIDQGLIDYVNERQRAEFQPLASEFERLYVEDGWQKLKESPRLFDTVVRENEPFGGQMRPPPPPGREGDGPNRRPPPQERPFGQRPPQAITLLDADRQRVGGPVQRFETATRLPIQVDDEIVGWLLLPKTDRLTRDFDIRFQSRQRDTFLVIGGIVIVLAGVFAFVLAPTLTRPIRQIAETANRLSRKQYDLPPVSKRGDEIGALSRDVHELGQTLERNEKMRQRWLADTSHELRTPLAIIRGEIEAMVDGIRPLSEAGLRSLMQEVLHLQKLIDDLADLSNADIGSLRYHKQVIDLVTLLRDNASHYRQLCEEAGLAFTFEDPGVSVDVYGDPLRLQQLFDNLVQNSCKYTDAPGQVEVSVAVSEGEVEIAVSDSEPGVPADAMPHLFDYLYRVEGSRNRRTGGSGLGLAIASRIVEAHEGRLVAAKSMYGGLMMTVYLLRED